MKKVKIISILLVVLLLTCVFCGFMGCETGYEKNLKRVKETDYFRYINYDGEDTVTILELTELGEQQEVLVIPEEIDGMKVVWFGGQIKGGSLVPTPNFMLVSAKIKKVYYLANIQRDKAFNCRIGFSSCKIICINDSINSHELDSFSVYNIFGYKKHFYFYNKNLIPEEFEAGAKNVSFEANVRFWVDDKIWWLDYVDNNEDIFIAPPAPTKAELAFDDWYLDEALTIKWNGEYKIPEGQEKLNLYAKFQ